jgi:hypothetical protein
MELASAARHLLGQGAHDAEPAAMGAQPRIRSARTAGWLISMALVAVTSVTVWSRASPRSLASASARSGSSSSGDQRSHRTGSRCLVDHNTDAESREWRAGFRSTFPPPDALPGGTGRNGRGRRMTVGAFADAFVHVTTYNWGQAGITGDPRGAAPAACKIAGIAVADAGSSNATLPLNNSRPESRPERIDPPRGGATSPRRGEFW